MNNIELQCKKYKDKYGIILDKNIGIRSLSIIEWYEYFVNGTPNGSKLYQIPQCFINKEELPKLFKYVIEEKIRFKTREEMLNLTQPIIEEYKISFSKTPFIKNSPYNILTLTYPELNIKGWEMVHAPTNYWNNYSNILDLFKAYVENITNEFGENINYNNYINDRAISLLCYKLYRAKKYKWNDKTWQDIINDCGLNIQLSNINIGHDGEILNSKEEVLLYDYIKVNLKINIKSIGLKRKKGYYFYNEKYDENYIPDFYIKNEKPIIIEYFGMYNETNRNKMFVDYNKKTERKIDFFNSLKDYIFIAIFPQDLKNNFEGLKNKLKLIL